MTDIQRRMLTHSKWSTTSIMHDTQADGDEKPAANDISSGDGYDGNCATLDDAAESVYRKCTNQLETGSKTCKDHDDIICPRKKFVMDDTSHSSLAFVTSARERSTNKHVTTTATTVVHNNNDGTGQNKSRGRCNKEDDLTSTNAIKVVGEKSVAVVSLMNYGVLPSTTNTSSTAKTQLLQQQYPPFNELLRAALGSYYRTHNINNQPIPVPLPPPFLSRAEESTLKTALAFVMAKARIRNRRKNENKESSITSLLSSSSSYAGGGVAVSTTNLIYGRCATTSASSNGGSISGGGAGSSNLVGRVGSSQPTSFSFEGLLVPPPLCHAVTPSLFKSTNANQYELSLERKLKHVREVLMLAVSAVLPLYRGALEVSEGDTRYATFGGGDAARSKLTKSNNCDDDDDTTVEQGNSTQSCNNEAQFHGRRPCAIYDFEAAVQPSVVGKRGQYRSSQPLSPAMTGREDQFQSTLDGLCQHIIVRLSALIRDEEAMQSDNIAHAKIYDSRVSCAIGTVESIRNVYEKCNKGSTSSCSTSRNGVSPTDMTDMSRMNTVNTDRRSSVRKSIVKLIYNDLISDAYYCHHGSQNLHTEYINIAREHKTYRIEKMMAVCHVIHRLIFLDKGCYVSTEVIVVVCSILSDLYSNQFGYAKINTGEAIHDVDSIVEDQRHQYHRPIQQDRGKHQIVPSRWTGMVSASNFNDRHIRRHSSVNTMGYDNACDEIAITKTIELPLPRIGDVLAVNLLRLLEGAAALRVHHRQERVMSSSRGIMDEEFMLDKVSSMAATEILTEIRSSVKHDLLIPLHVEDVAKFYCDEKMLIAEDDNADDTDARLLVGAKIMLRLHIFGLMTKIALYER